MRIWAWRMTRHRRLVLPEPSADAERAYPALRHARVPAAPDRTAGARPDRRPPPGDWSTAALRLHADVASVIAVVLRDADDALRDLPLLDPGMRLGPANRVLRERTGTGAVFTCDVDHPDRGFRVRFCTVNWPGAEVETLNAYHSLFTAWREAGLKDGAFAPAIDKEQRGGAGRWAGFNWCLGPNDLIEVDLDDASGGRIHVGATRAFLTNDERTRCT